MLAQTFALIVTLTTVCCNSKLMKTLPTVSHSFLNLGKIDVSFNFYGKDPGSMYKNHIPPSPLISPPKSKIMIDIPCPCSGLQSSKAFPPHPLEIISKVLKSKDLFKEPSSACCDFHEVQEGVTFIEIPHKNVLKNNRFTRPLPPVFADSLPKTAPVFKPNAIELFLFPKGKDLNNFEFIKTTANKTVPKENLKFVDKTDKSSQNYIKEVPETLTKNDLKEKKSENLEDNKQNINSDNKSNTLGP